MVATAMRRAVGHELTTLLFFVFKTCLLARARGCHALINGISFSFSTDVGSHSPPSWKPNFLARARSSSGSSILTNTSPHIYSLQCSTTSLAHLPVSDSNTICNSLSPPLVDVVLFRLSLLSFPSKFSKHVKL